MVNQELLVELKNIIKEDYGMELPMQTVSEIGTSLVNYFELLAKIDREEPIEGELKQMIYQNK